MDILSQVMPLEDQSAYVHKTIITYIFFGCITEIISFCFGEDVIEKGDKWIEAEDLLLHQAIRHRVCPHDTVPLRYVLVRLSQHTATSQLFSISLTVFNAIYQGLSLTRWLLGLSLGKQQTRMGTVGQILVIVLPHATHKISLHIT